MNVEAEIQIFNLIYYRSVGKSSLAIQFVQGQFVDYYEPTIENTFNKTINIKGRRCQIDDCIIQTGLKFANLKCQMVEMCKLRPARQICKIDATLEKAEAGNRIVLRSFR